MARRGKRGQGTVFKRGAIWWVQYFVHGKPFRESSKSTEKRDADALLKQRLAEVVTGAHAGVSSAKVGDLLDLFVADYIEQQRHDLYIAKKRIALHIRPMLGRIRAADFGSADLKHYIKARREGKCCSICRARTHGAANATINRELAIIRRGFKLAVKNDPPLAVRVPSFPKLDEANERTGVALPDHYDCLKRVLPPHAALALSIGYHTGMRRGLILGLLWAWVDLAAGVIRIPSGDTATKKRPRVVPIYGDMQAMLEMAQSAAKTDYVIEYSGHRVSEIKRAWATGCKTCGITALLFHDLRRTAATNALLAGIPEIDILEMCGWKTLTMLRRYAQGLVKRAQATGRKMEEFMESQRPTPVEDRRKQ